MMLTSMATPDGPPDRSRWISIVPWAALAFFLAFHGHAIWSQAVDVPYWDEWEMFREGWLPSGVFGRWIVAHHNEHRVVPTHLTVVASHLLGGLSFSSIIRFNVLFYVALVGSFAWLATRGLPSRDSAWLAPFLLPLASPLTFENQRMAGQNCVHYLLLSFAWGTWLLFTGRTALARSTGVVLWILSIYSHASGIPAVLAGLGAWIVLVGLQYGKRLEAAGYSFILIAAIGLWFRGYAQVQGHPEPALPANPAFVGYFGELLAAGFGYGQINSIAAALALGFAAGALGLGFQLVRAGGAESKPALAVLLGVLAILSSIAIGRAGFGTAHAKSGRYAEFAALVPPLGASLLLRARQIAAWPRYAGLAAAAIFLVAGIRGDLSFRPYYDWKRDRESDLDCVRRALDSEDPAFASCPRLYPGEIRTLSRSARAVGARFASP